MTLLDIVLTPFRIVKGGYDLFWEVFLRKMPLDEFEDYNDYWEKRKNLPIKYRYKYVASLLPEKGRILDVGCGDGTFLKYLKTQKPDLVLMGIDVSKSAIASLKEEGIDGMTYDLTQDELPSELEADYVVIMELIEHIPNPEVLMKRIKVVKARRYYVTIPNLGFIENRLRLALGGKMPITMIIYHIKEHLRFWTVTDFKYWADCMGYKVVGYCGQGSVEGKGWLFIWRIWPSLFAKQVIYTLEDKKFGNGAM